MKFPAKSRVLGRCVCGLIFITAAVAKVMAPAPFLDALSHLRWIPASLQSPLAISLPLVELLLGIALIVGWQKILVARVTFLLLVLFTVVLFTLPAGAACGCFGSVDGPLGWFVAGNGAIVRNLVLLGITGWLGFARERSRILPMKEA